MATVTPLRKDKPTARELLQGIKVIDVDTHVSEWHSLWTCLLYTSPSPRDS